MNTLTVGISWRPRPTTKPITIPTIIVSVNLLLLQRPRSDGSCICMKPMCQSLMYIYVILPYCVNVRVSQLANFREEDNRLSGVTNFYNARARFEQQSLKGALNLTGCF